MKTEVLKIEIPKGFKVKSFDQETGEIKFEEKPKEVTERIKTIDDVLEALGKKDLDVIQYRKLQSADVSEYVLGNQEAVLICKALNEGWVPDWGNSSEYKYFPWFDRSSSGFRCRGDVGWHATSVVGSRLCLKSSELAKYAGTQFTDVYEKFMLIK